MNREEKGHVIDELVEKFNSNNNFYITDASGFTVTQVNNFRQLCFNSGVEFKVYKNTLIKKALDQMETDYAEFDEKGVLKGFSGILFSQEVSNLPAKIISDFRKKYNNEKPILKGASIDSDLYIGDDQLKSLTSLKSKQELIGEIIGLLQSPAKNVISALQSGEHNLAGIIRTLADKQE